MSQPLDLAQAAASFRLKEFARTLLPASSNAAQGAVRALSDNDDVTACAAAGQAVELLAKAYLCSVNPLLLLAGNVKDDDDYLILAGFGHHSRRDLLSARTVTGQDAFVRALTFLGQRPDVASLRQRVLFRARGASLHLGQVERGWGRRAIGDMARLALPLLDELGTDLSAWLADEAGLALLVLDETKRSEAVVAHARLRDATVRWKELSENLPEHTLQVLSKAIAATAARGGRLRDCPVGGHQAIWSGEWEASDVQNAPPGWRDWELIPTEVQCGICGLSLEYDELEALDMATPIDFDTWAIDGCEDEEDDTGGDDEPEG